MIDYNKSNSLKDYDMSDTMMDCGSFRGSFVLFTINTLLVIIKYL